MGGLVIAGDRSGAGKTTVTMALLAALRAQGTTVQAFKVGPDYIDPMFHRAITGRPAYNLDPVLTSEAYVQQCFQQHRPTATYAVVEGVMGLFDGAGGTDWGSTAHVARLLGCPVVLVVDCARLSRSLAAIVHGFKTLDPRVILAGVVLNRVGSDRHLAMLQAAIAPLGVPVLGVLRRDDAVTLPDRHLGLVPTDELPDLPERFRYLAALGQRCFDWPALAAVLQRASSLPVPTREVSGQSPLPRPSVDDGGRERRIPLSLLEEPGRCLGAPENSGAVSRVGAHSSAPLRDRQNSGIERLFHAPETTLPLEDGGKAMGVGQGLRIGVARDRAFNFYYEDNLTSLRALGADLVPFSPLADEALPPDLSGLILGGGFPEMFAAELAANQPLRAAIAQHLTAGLPTYAECGGLMYLCQTLVDFEGRSWPMVGALPATTTLTGRLTLGYRHATAQQSSPLVTLGQKLWGHEFHRSQIVPTSPQPLYALTGYPLSPTAPPPLTYEGWARETLHGSYVHLHWGAYPALPRRFLTQCDR